MQHCLQLSINHSHCIFQITQLPSFKTLFIFSLYLSHCVKCLSSHCIIYYNITTGEIIAICTLISIQIDARDLNTTYMIIDCSLTNINSEAWDASVGLKTETSFLEILTQFFFLLCNMRNYRIKSQKRYSAVVVLCFQ